MSATLLSSPNRTFTLECLLTFSYPHWGNILSVSRFKIAIITDICCIKLKFLCLPLAFSKISKRKKTKMLIMWQNLSFQFFPPTRNKRYTTHTSVTALVSCHLSVFKVFNSKANKDPQLSTSMVKVTYWVLSVSSGNTGWLDDLMYPYLMFQRGIINGPNQKMRYNA